MDSLPASVFHAHVLVFFSFITNTQEGRHTSVNDSHWGFETCYMCLHSPIASWFIITSIRYTDPETSRFYIVRAPHPHGLRPHTQGPHIYSIPGRRPLHSSVTCSCEELNLHTITYCERHYLFKHTCLRGIHIPSVPCPTFSSPFSHT